MSESNLERFGWTPERETEFDQHRAEGLVPARVTLEHRIAYLCQGAEGEVRAELAGRLRHEGELPAVGDWVALRPPATIVAVLPRHTVFSRKEPFSGTVEQVLAANADTVFVTTALTRDFNPRRMERYLATAWESGAQPVVVLTKRDLCHDVERVLREAESVALGVPVHAVSGVTGEGVAELEAYLVAGQTVALLGSSGVGKSTLINRLAGCELLATQEVRADGRGRHTTTHRELVPLPKGGLVLDTPGLRELQLWDAATGLETAFDDVASLAADCRFTDCEHRSEPGCAVRSALAEGVLTTERLESYRKLQRELARLERRRNDRLRAEAARTLRSEARERRHTQRPPRRRR